MTKTPIVPVLLALTVLSGSGCGRVVGVAAAVADTQVLTLQPSTLSLQTNVPAPLTAVATSDSGVVQDMTQTVSWQTSSNALTVVRGSATCSQAGTYTVSASTPTLHAAAASITCVVVAAPKTLKAITFINPPTVVMSTSPSLLTVQAIYVDGSTSDVTSQVSWISDEIAHVNANGIAYCNTSGDANISATFKSSTIPLRFKCFVKHVRSHVGFVERHASFYGPFPSWLDVKAVFGAKGDGVTDDTKALQQGLEAAKQQGKALYLPHGVYVATDTLHLVGADGTILIGEEPTNTSIKWMGALHGTMVSFEGSTRFRMSRITLDGNSYRAGIGIYVGSTFTDGQLYPTFDALEDLQIHHTDAGLLLGFAGETTVNRVHFYHNTVGALLTDWNALNFNVVDSLFTDNQIGVSNDPGCGMFNVSHSIFVRSSVTDMLMGNTGSFSVRQNLSVDSQAFFVDLKSGAAAAVTLQENVIRGSKGVPIRYGNQGVLMLIDNTFEGPVDPQQALVISEASIPTNIFSLGNVFSSVHPFQGSIGTVQSIDEQPQVAVAVSAVKAPSNVYVPPASSKHVFEMPVGASAAVMQQTVNDAAVRSGGAIVHFAAGEAFRANTTIDVPDAPELALVGDGPTSAIVDAGVLQGYPVLRTHGSVEIDGLYIGASKTGLGLQVLVKDQPSTSIFCDLCTTFDTTVGVAVSGLDNVKLTTVASQIGGLHGITVSGGANQASGQTTLGSTNAFMTTSDTYTVNNMGHFLLSDGFHDGAQQPMQAAIKGAGVITQQGGVINAQGMTLKGFSGVMSLLGVQINTWLKADTTSSGTVGLVGTVNFNTSFDLAGSSANLEQASGYGFVSGRLVPLTMNAADVKDVEHLFAQSRTEDVLPREQAIVGADTVRLHRVMVQHGSVAMSFGPTPTGTSAATYVIRNANHTDSNTASCSAGSVSLNGTWSLERGNDGFYGLKLGGSYLDNMIPVAGGAGTLTFGSQMTNAGQRWLIEPSGYGTFTITNRADGNVLSRTPSGCTTITPTDGGDGQQWAVAATTI